MYTVRNQQHVPRSLKLKLFPQLCFNYTKTIDNRVLAFHWKLTEYKLIAIFPLGHYFVKPGDITFHQINNRNVDYRYDSNDRGFILRVFCNEPQ